MNYYVYSHVNPVTGNPFYIGKGVGSRCHDKSGRTPAWKLLVKGMADRGITYEVRILSMCKDEMEAFQKEREAIQERLEAGCILVNKVVGLPEGDNFILADSEYVPDEWNRSGTLATFVRTKRKSCKLTQEQIADRAGVGLRLLREIEAGKPTLRIDSVNQVLHLFGYEMAPCRKSPR